MRSLQEIIDLIPNQEKVKPLLRKHIPGGEQYAELLTMVDTLESSDDVKKLIDILSEYNDKMAETALTEIKGKLETLVNGIRNPQSLQLTQAQREFTAESTAGKLRESIKTSIQGPALSGSNPRISLKKYGVTTETSLLELSKVLDKYIEDKKTAPNKVIPEAITEIQRVLSQLGL